MYVYLLNYSYSGCCFSFSTDWDSLIYSQTHHFLLCPEPYETPRPIVYQITPMWIQSLYTQLVFVVDETNCAFLKYWPENATYKKHVTFGIGLRNILRVSCSLY